MRWRRRGGRLHNKKQTNDLALGSESLSELNDNHSLAYKPQWEATPLSLLQKPELSEEAYSTPTFETSTPNQDSEQTLLSRPAFSVSLVVPYNFIYFNMQ